MTTNTVQKNKIRTRSDTKHVKTLSAIVKIVEVTPGVSYKIALLAVLYDYIVANKHWVRRQTKFRDAAIKKLDQLIATGWSAGDRYVGKF